MALDHYPAEPERFEEAWGHAYDPEVSELAGSPAYRRMARWHREDAGPAITIRSPEWFARAEALNAAIMAGPAPVALAYLATPVASVMAVAA